mgnify:CR=1 FL=1
MTRIEPRPSILQSIGQRRRHVKVYARIPVDVRSGKVVWLRPKGAKKSGLRALADALFRRAA